MKIILGLIMTVAFSTAFAKEKRTPVVFDDMLNQTLTEQKEAKSQMGHLIEEADYQEKTKSVVRIIEKANSNKKVQ